MSVPVPLDKLRDAIGERGPVAFLLTVSDDTRPHAVQCPVRWDGDALVVDVGRRSAANAGARPGVSLLFPARTAGDYSLIVDGTAGVAAGALRIAPTGAVLHRPAPAPRPESACGADCVPLIDRGRPAR